MNVVVNGVPTVVPDALTVRGLIEHLGLGDGPVAVERNREIVPRARHGAEVVIDGDVFELVHLVGGG